MIVRTFKKYGADGGSFVEQPGPYQIPEGDRVSSAARGRGHSRKAPVSSPAIGEGSSSVGINGLEKSGPE